MNKQEKQELEKLLKIQWGSESMVKHCLKSTKYIKMDDYYLSVGSKKPTIQKEFWYDDEKPIPKVTKELFIGNNIRHNAPKDYEPLSSHGDELVIINQYHRNNTGGKLKALTYQRDNEYSEAIKVTPEMLETINKARAEIRTDFIKRLERYWKRYSQHVMNRGYWVNR